MKEFCHIVFSCFGINVRGLLNVLSYYQMFRPTRYKFFDTQEIKIKFNFKNLQLVKFKRQNNSRFTHI